MKHLIDLKKLPLTDISQIVRLAEVFKKGRKVPFFLPETKSVVNLFLEASTRTRFSFELAQKRLGMQVMSFSASSSSMEKGESFYDTVKNLEAMGVDSLVVRTSDNEALNTISEKVNLSIVNAGSGTRHHPTQALLDLMTIKTHFSGVEGLHVAIVGDISHSRVAHSHLDLLPKLGVNVSLCSFQDLGDDYSAYNHTKIDEIIEKVDVLMMLRVQNERHHDGITITNEQYHEIYGLTEARYRKLKSSAIVMHPGPYIRDKEIASSLIEADKVKIFEQVNNGTFVRMAVMDYVLGGKLSESLLTT
ncbi:MAG: aspartate carbamoyltransferase catalytic subunit [Bdellovibrionales bacterium]|nr:aspartate carbamoyltransferase catalytic subunit [Bdellovibrionales bacterium]